MDLGRFERSRFQFWTWILLPVVLMIAVTLPSYLYRLHVRRQLDEYQRLLAAVPATERVVRDVESLLKSVTPASTRVAEATEGATRRLDEAAKAAGLTLRALKVGEDVTTDGGFTSVRLGVQIQGGLPAVVQWMDDVQKPGMLISVQAATLNALSLPPTDSYSGDITLYLRLRKEG